MSGSKSLSLGKSLDMDLECRSVGSVGSSSTGPYSQYVASTPNLWLLRSVSRQVSDDSRGSRSRKHSPSSFLGELTFYEIHLVLKIILLCHPFLKSCVLFSNPIGSDICGGGNLVRLRKSSLGRSAPSISTSSVSESFYFKFAS